MAKRAPEEPGGPADRGAGRRRLPAGLALGLWGLTLLGLATAALLDRRLRQAGFPELASSGAAAAPELVAAVSAASVGAVLASRRPRHRVGWLLLGLGLAISAHVASFAATRYGLVARPGSLPGADYLAGPHNGTVFVYLSVAGFVLLLTPPGRCRRPTGAGGPGSRPRRRSSAWWRRRCRPGRCSPNTPTSGTRCSSRPWRPRWGWRSARAPWSSWPPWWSRPPRWCCASAAPAGPSACSCAGSPWPRALAVVALLVTILASGVASQVAIGLCVALLPLATGAAILRYRLYDLDRIISRTVAYALLTLLLGLGYAAVVLGVGRLLPQSSSLAVAAATLAVAALFQPLRRRVQAAVDRRFNRRRHDAGRTIAAFGSRLREEVDLDTLTAEVLAVVDQTMQPTRASLWLRGT